MCFANPRPPAKRPGFRYAVNHAICMGCGVVHCRLEDSSDYTNDTDNCLTKGCLHKLSDQQQIELLQKKKDTQQTTNPRCVYCVHYHRESRKSGINAANLGNEQERIRQKMIETMHEARKFSENTIEDYVSTMLSENWDSSLR